MVDLGCRLPHRAGNGGRAKGKERMARPRYQDGTLYTRGKRIKVWVARWREDVIRDDGTLTRIQRKVVLGAVNKISLRQAKAILQAHVSEVNQGKRQPTPTMSLDTFTRDHWKAGMLLALKPSSARYYQYQLDKYISPTLGSRRLCDVSRARIQAFLLEQRHDGYSTATIHGIRTILHKGARRCC